MNDVLLKIGFGILNNTKISLAVLIIAIVFLTPVFTATTSFVQTVWAHDRIIKENTKKFDSVLMLNEKINLLMIEQGIQKYKIQSIENRYKQPNEGK